jgi:hypothetical protein
MHLRSTFTCIALTLLLETPTLLAEKPEMPDSARVEFYKKLLPEKARGLGAPISDRKAWEDLAKRSDCVGKIKENAEAALKTPLPELTDELYREYSRSGKRDSCQAVMFARHDRLRNLTLAECFANEGRYLPAIEAMIRSYCAENSWLYPAHDSGLRVFKGERQDIDLAASNLAWQLATVDYWVGEKLSVETRKLLADELERRIYTPVTGMVTGGKPWINSLHARGNHCAVDVAGVTGSALAQIESRDRRALFAAAAENYVEYFLSGFTPDGYCSEGVGYWGYGFGHYVMLAETIKQATGGKVDWLAQERILPIAQYARRMEILPGVYPAFADCDVNPQPEHPLMDYLNRRYGWGLEEFSQPPPVLSSSLEMENGLFAIGVFAFPNSLNNAQPVNGTLDWNMRDWFSDAGVLICRPRAAGLHALGAAIKGGHNAEQHNHNDVGSFVVALGKTTPIVDPGPEVYTSRTFGPHRYDSKVLSSFGHSVPRAAGQLQATGAKSCAKILKTNFTDDTDTLVMDITSAYPVESLEKITRTFVFSRAGAGKLSVIDEVEFTREEDFGTALITLAKWKQLGPNQLQIGEGAEAVQVEIVVEGGEFRLDPQEIKENLPEHLVPIRLGLDLTKPVKKAKITTIITPVA